MRSCAGPWGRGPQAIKLKGLRTETDVRPSGQPGPPCELQVPVQVEALPTDKPGLLMFQGVSSSGRGLAPWAGPQGSDLGSPPSPAVTGPDLSVLQARNPSGSLRGVTSSTCSKSLPPPPRSSLAQDGGSEASASGVTARGHRLWPQGEQGPATWDLHAGEKAKQVTTQENTRSGRGKNRRWESGVLISPVKGGSGVAMWAVRRARNLKS